MTVAGARAREDGERQLACEPLAVGREGRGREKVSLKEYVLFQKDVCARVLRQRRERIIRAHAIDAIGEGRRGETPYDRVPNDGMNFQMNGDI
jgi:hypothetical protein